MPHPLMPFKAARTLIFGGAALVVSSLFSVSAARAQALFRLPDHVPAVVATAKKLGPVSPTSKVTVLLSLPLRDESGLQALLSGLYDPKSPLYGQYLTPDKFTARFAPSLTDYNAVIAFAKSQGLTVQTYDSRVLVSVSGTAAALQTALSTHLNNYKATDGTAFFAPDTNPGLPTGLAGKISGVLGLSNYAKLKPLFRTATVGQIASARALVPTTSSVGTGPGTNFGGGTGHGGAFAPKDLRTAYDMTGLPVDGTGQSVGLYEEGGFFPEDIDRYEDFYGLPDVPVTVVPVDGFSGAVSDLGVSEEAALDIDMVLALAPGSKEIRVYESPLNYPQGLIDALDLAAKQNVSKTFSISYGLAEQIVGLPVILAENTQLKRLAAEGTTVYASSGDQGAYTDGIVPAVSDPASQPLITAVGGTALYTAPGGAYLGETSWNELGLFGAAGGGGVSTVWKIPAYQTLIDPTLNGGSATMRNVPDVALDAAILTGVDVYSTAVGGWADFGGTSVSSPLWAAYTARVNQARSEAGLKPLGFANPALYAIGASFLSFFDFHDVIDGTNGNAAIYGIPGFTTGFGYDDVTGFGSFDGAQMLGDLAATPSNAATPPAAPTYFKGAPGNGQVTLIWKASKNARGYYVFRAPALDRGGFLAATKSLSYVDKAVKNGVLYEYVLEAVGDGGGTAASYPIYVKPSATPGE